MNYWVQLVLLRGTLNQIQITASTQAAKDKRYMKKTHTLDAKRRSFQYWKKSQ